MLQEKTLTNPFFRHQALSADGTGPYSLPDGRRLNCGAFPQASGDVLIRLLVPGAEQIRLHVDVSEKASAEVTLEPLGQDVFEGTLPFDPRLTGPANVRVYVNGALVLVPDLPVIWTNNRPQNNIEIPDPDGDYCLQKRVPHGTLHREILFSHGTGREERCIVYTPPGYGETDRRYPALYLLHGGGDNELMWEYVGKMSNILDNLWNAGEAVPFITVMMNGMLRRDGQAGMPVDGAFEETLLTDAIPFAESRYRVLADREHRAVAGLSMGAYMSCDIGFAHPELFASIGTFTASMSDKGDKMAYERPWPRVLAEGAEAFAARYRLYFRSTTPQENHPEFFAADDALLHEAGIDALPCHHRILYPERTGKWNSWRMGLRDFARLVFKD